MSRKNSQKITRQVLSIFIVVCSFLVSCSRQPTYPEPSLVGREIVIDVGKLQTEIPKYFTYHYHGKGINFFVVKVNDKVLSFLDACMGCYAEKRGYRFDGGYLICKACNVRYSVSEIEKGFGSCFPIRITGRLQNGKYFIPISALEGMADKF